MIDASLSPISNYDGEWYVPEERAALMGEVTAVAEQAIRKMITSGDLGPDARMPSERTLAADLTVSRTTIRIILLKLTTEGLIRAEHGRGYFVNGPSS